MMQHPVERLSTLAHSTDDADRPFLRFRPNLELPTMTLSYRHVYEQACALALWLGDQGVQARETIAVWLGDGLQYIPLLFAIWMKQAVYMPLPIHPSDEQLGYPALVNARYVIVANEAHRTRLPNALVYPQDLRMGDVFVSDVLSLDHDAYTFCSSGSTGRPKIIINDFTGIAPRIRSALEIMGVSIQRPSCFLGFLKREFDANLFDIFCALYSGSALYLVPELVRQNPARYLADFVHAAAVPQPAIAILIPSLLQVLDPMSLPSIRMVLTTGENLSRRQIAAWLEAGRVICNAYGPTENTIGSTILPIRPEDHTHPLVRVHEGRLLGMLEGAQLFLRPRLDTDDAEGKPMFGALISLKDAIGRPIPEAELVIGGLGVGRYAAVVEVQQQPRFETRETGRFFYTRDQVSWMNGALVYEGRYDRQIKRNSQLVNMDDIERRLEDLSEGDVRPLVQAIVRAFPRPYGTEAVVAFVSGDLDWLRTRYFSAVAAQIGDRRYHPDFTFTLQAPPMRLGDKKDHKLDALGHRGPGLLTTGVGGGVDSPLMQELRNIWHDLVVPHTFSEAPFAFRPEDLPLDAKLSELGASSLMRTELYRQLLTHYARPERIPNEHYRAELEEELHFFTLADKSLRDFEQLLTDYFALNHIHLRHPEVGVIGRYILVPHQARLGLWLRTHVNAETARGHLSYHFSAKIDPHSHHFWQLLGVQNPADLRGRGPITLYVEDADVLPTFGDAQHFFASWPCFEGLRIHFHFLVPSLAFVPPEERTQVSFLEGVAAGPIPQTLQALFLEGIQRYSGRFDETPTFQAFCQYCMQFLDCFWMAESTILIGDQHVWRSLLPSGEEVLSQFQYHPFFAFLTPWLSISPERGVTIEAVYQRQLEAAMGLASTRLSSVPINRSWTSPEDEASFSKVSWLPQALQNFVRILKTGHHYPPLILLHPLTGDIPRSYNVMAEQALPGQAVYAISMDSNHVFASLEEQLAMYLRVIKALEPRGPYILGGWSYGGMLSHQLATRLEAEDCEVLQVINIDCPPLHQLMTLAAPRESAIQMIRHFVVETFRLAPEFNPPVVEAVGLDAIRHLFLSTRDHYFRAAFGEKPKEGRSFYALMTAACENFLILQAYQQAGGGWQRLRAPVLHFVAAQRIHTLTEGVDFGAWRDLEGGEPTIIQCQGNHFTLFSDERFLPGIRECLHRHERSLQNERISRLLADLRQSFVDAHPGRPEWELTVSQPDLLRSGARVVSLLGPAGSGKSTWMAQWMQAPERAETWILPLSMPSHYSLEDSLLHEGFSEADITQMKARREGVIILDGVTLPSAERLAALQRDWPSMCFILLAQSKNYNTLPEGWPREAPVCHMQAVSEDLVLGLALDRGLEELSLSARELLQNPWILTLFLEEADPGAMTIERFQLFQNFWHRSIDQALQKIKIQGLPIGLSEASMRAGLEHFSLQQAAAQIGSRLGWREDPRLLENDAVSLLCRRYYVLPPPLIEFVFAHYAYRLLQVHATGSQDPRISTQLQGIFSQLSVPVAERISECFALFLSRTCSHALIRQIPALIQQFAGRITHQFVQPGFLVLVQGMLSAIALEEAPGTAAEQVIVSRLIAWTRDPRRDVEVGAKMLLARAITMVVLGPLRLTAENYQDRLNQQVTREAWQVLPPALLAILQPYFRCDLSAVRFATGVNTYHGMNMTLGNRIYFVTPPLLHTPAGFHSFVYMLAHVEQFHEHGGLEPFILRYLTEALFKGYALLPRLDAVGLTGVQAYILAVHDEMGLERNAQAKADRIWQEAFNAYIRTHPRDDMGRVVALPLAPPQPPERRMEEALAFAQQLLTYIPRDSSTDFHRTALRASLLARVLMETTQAVGPSPEAQARAGMLAFSLLARFGEFRVEDQALVQASLGIPSRREDPHPHR